MRILGIYLAVAGAAVIALFVLYRILTVILHIPSVWQLGIGLLVAGGILVTISLVRERVSDARKESFRGTRQ